MGKPTVSGGPKTVDFTWNGIAITVSITHNWLHTDHHHIELRADQPLPVTSTGYRSLFLPIDESRRFKSLEEVLKHWLDDAANSKEWIKAQEEQRQLKLF